MKLGDLTLNQICELCNSHPTCADCSLSCTEDYGDAQHLRCIARTVFALVKPREASDYLLNRDVYEVQDYKNVRCADCAYGEVFRGRVICQKTYGLELYPDSFCSEGVARNEVG